jgi:hypothetical protein
MQEHPTSCECEHHFIRDLIDITPDHSKEIVYCEYCEYIPSTFVTK